MLCDVGGIITTPAFHVMRYVYSFFSGISSFSDLAGQEEFATTVLPCLEALVQARAIIIILLLTYYVDIRLGLVVACSFDFDDVL